MVPLTQSYYIWTYAVIVKHASISRVFNKIVFKTVNITSIMILKLLFVLRQAKNVCLVKHADLVKDIRIKSGFNGADINMIFLWFL